MREIQEGDANLGGTQPGVAGEQPVDGAIEEFLQLGGHADRVEPFSRSRGGRLAGRRSAGNQKNRHQHASPRPGSSFTHGEDSPPRRSGLREVPRGENA